MLEMLVDVMGAEKILDSEIRWKWKVNGRVKWEEYQKALEELCG